MHKWIGHLVSGWFVSPFNSIQRIHRDIRFFAKLVG